MAAQNDPTIKRAFDRRSLLLASAGVLAAGCTATAPQPAPKAAKAPAPFDPGDWQSVRDQFQLTRDTAHFSAFMLASHPAPVRIAVEELRAGLDSFPQQYGMGMQDFERSDKVRQALAGYLGGRPDEIALTDSATMGIGLVYGGLRLKEGDEIVTTDHEFYSTYEALRLRTAATGAKQVTVRVYEDPAKASAAAMAAAVTDAITDRTRVLAMTWVHSSTGVKLPVKAIADAVARINASRDQADRIVLCVDGVHGFAAENSTMADLGCDLFMSSGHKWLFGPRGTGFVWGNAAGWEQVDQVIPSFSMPAFMGWFAAKPPAGPPGQLGTPGGYHSFEHRWALAAAVDFHRSIGLARVAERVRTQADQLKEGLAALRHVRLVTPRAADVSAGIVCCAVDGMEPEAVVKRLGEQGVSAAATPYRESFVRFGPSIVTSPQEVDRAVKAMAGLA
ncbi:aminotransferase class V-fold PLP-dependent enzyme [Nonomuraea wenchangensis]